ncbi:peptidoglycan-associated lipoprotein Pal [SAR86 cluster bacterium]|nr:peptidoglycan-associated lipoprotein Pal [SAR86 cluster bacterium]MEC8108047.1 peptidoglycan-associated lipoprotein Pal [Pseudomonadota bacterium]
MSDSVSQTNYVEIDGIDFNEEDKIETSLADRVYFDFDKSNLSDETKNILSQYVSESKKASLIRLEGHCDERGTREYNLALGEKRAIEVKNYLIIQGVSSSKIKIISYGEEKPVSYGSSEEDWKQNRRVEISLF